MGIRGAERLTGMEHGWKCCAARTLADHAEGHDGDTREVWGRINADRRRGIGSRPIISITDQIGSRFPMLRTARKAQGQGVVATNLGNPQAVTFAAFRVKPLPLITSVRWVRARWHTALISPPSAGLGQADSRQLQFDVREGSGIDYPIGGEG